MVVGSVLQGRKWKDEEKGRCQLKQMVAVGTASFAACSAGQCFPPRPLWPAVRGWRAAALGKRVPPQPQPRQALSGVLGVLTENHHSGKSLCSLQKSSDAFQEGTECVRGRKQSCEMASMTPRLLPSFLPSISHACTSAVWFYHGGAYLPNEMETAG